MYFIQRNNLARPPWRVKDPERGLIVDSSGRTVALVPAKTPHITVDNSQTQISTRWPDTAEEWIHPDELAANLNLIAAAPELLAALKEAAFHLDQAGIPLNEPYYELINRASSGLEPLKPRTRKNT
ncbi:MAG: hypothetical protein ACO3YZ_06725 [Candidatus Nanopelagicaceae bacterium]